MRSPTDTLGSEYPSNSVFRKAQFNWHSSPPKKLCCSTFLLFLGRKPDIMAEISVFLIYICILYKPNKQEQTPTPSSLRSHVWVSIFCNQNCLTNHSHKAVRWCQTCSTELVFILQLLPLGVFSTSKSIFEKLSRYCIFKSKDIQHLF